MVKRAHNDTLLHILKGRLYNDCKQKIVLRADFWGFVLLKVHHLGWSKSAQENVAVAALGGYGGLYSAQMLASAVQPNGRYMSTYIYIYEYYVHMYICICIHGGYVGLYNA